MSEIWARHRLMMIPWRMSLHGCLARLAAASRRLVNLWAQLYPLPWTAFIK
jgi:hypothetical protein